MTSKKFGLFLMKLVLVISCSQKNPTYVSLCHKDLKQSLLVKVNSKNTYICRQLKYHQHRIRSKTGISLVIILNVFKCLKVSLVPLKFLLWQQHHFCLLQLASSVNLLRCNMCTFYCRRRRKRYIHYSSLGYRSTYSEAHSSKRFKPLSDIMLLCQGLKCH